MIKTSQRIIMMMLCLLSITGCLSKPAQTTKLIPAEKAGWKLAFSDNFNRNELGGNWKVINGDWKITDGTLCGNGTLISTKEFLAGNKPGYQRLEFEAASDAQPFLFFKNKPKFKVIVSDISSFIHAKSPKTAETPMNTGYFFQFGGRNNQINQLKKAGVMLKVDSNPAKTIIPDKHHKIVAENDNGLLRLFIDGALVLETQDKQSILSSEHNKVGFYFFTAAKVFNVKVYVKQTANLN